MDYVDYVAEFDQCQMYGFKKENACLYSTRLLLVRCNTKMVARKFYKRIEGKRTRVEDRIIDSRVTQKVPAHIDNIQN